MSTSTAPAASARVDPPSWADANDAVMRARVGLAAARLMVALRAGVGEGVDETPSRCSERVATTASVADAVAGVRALEQAMPFPSAFAQVRTLFGLSEFEAELLALCAAVELDSEVARLCERAGGAGAVATFGLALAVLPDAHWSALTPTRPLRHWLLLDLGPGEGLTTRPLQLDERILHELVGVPTIDRHLVGALRLRPRSEPDDISRGLATTVAAHWGANEPGGGPVLELIGARGAGRERLAAAIADVAGFAVAELDLADARRAAVDNVPFARRCAREAAITGSVLVVDADRLDPDHTLGSFVAAADAPVVVLSRTPLGLDRLGGRRSRRVEVPALTVAQRSVLWRRAVPPTVDDSTVAALAARFPLGADDIAAIGAESEVWAAAPDAEATPAPDADSNVGNTGSELGSRLWDAARRQARPVLEPLARRRVGTAGWGDLVLPEEQLDVLRQLAAQVRQGQRVVRDWGFGALGGRGLGTTALFAGPSGTGKTTAAEVLANDLRLDLYCVDLAMVVDKYIGETEKHLSRIFDAAEGSGVVLLFDEADALFGKRSEVRDSHDRYANVEVAYLLQRVEEYRGLAILTTNARTAIDPAFLRRLRFVVTFPFPDLAQRAELWRRAFPAATPLEGIDPAALARLNVAGGSIRNIALNAAFLAADQDRPVRTADIVRAARAEYAKAERPLTDAELRGLR